MAIDFCVIKGGYISLQHPSLWGRRQRLPASVPDHKLWITFILKEVEGSNFLITAASQHIRCLHSNARIVSCNSHTQAHPQHIPHIPTSVSGRGINTGGLIFSVRSWKSHSPSTYCTGILQQAKGVWTLWECPGRPEELSCRAHLPADHSPCPGPATASAMCMCTLREQGELPSHSPVCYQTLEPGTTGQSASPQYQGKRWNRVLKAVS